MSGEFRQCQTFFKENVGGNVGGILLIYENTSVSKCLSVSHVSISTDTLSVFSYRQNLVRDSQIVQNDWYQSKIK